MRILETSLPRVNFIRISRRLFCGARKKERKKEGKKSLIGFFVRKIRIQTIGLQLEPSKSIRSFPPIYIYTYKEWFKTILLFESCRLATRRENLAFPFHESCTQRKYLNRMKRMDKSNYAELPFAGHISRRHISHKYIRYSRFDLRGWLARAPTLSFFGPTLPPEEGGNPIYRRYFRWI